MQTTYTVKVLQYKYALCFLGVSGLIIYLVFYTLLAPETGYTRGYCLGSEKHKDILGETVFITFPFIWDQYKRSGVDGLILYPGFSGLLALDLGH